MVKYATMDVSEIMLVAGALSVCNLFIKSVFFFFFWSGASEISYNTTVREDFEQCLVSC